MKFKIKLSIHGNCIENKAHVLMAGNWVLCHSAQDWK